LDLKDEAANAIYEFIEEAH